MSTNRALADARRISQLLIEVADLSKDVFANIAAELNVPVQLAKALCLLETAAPMTELATKLSCDKSYVTPLADQLESLGLINRVPGADRRTKLLQLTPKGEKLRQQLGEKVAAFSPATVALSQRELVAFEAMLQKILNP